MKRIILIAILLLFVIPPAHAQANAYPRLSANCGQVGVRWHSPLPYTALNGGDVFLLVSRKDVEPELIKMDYVGWTGDVEYWRARVPFAPGERVLVSAYVKTEWEYWPMGEIEMGCGLWLPAVVR